MSGGAPLLSPEFERLIAQAAQALAEKIGLCKCRCENGPFLGGLAAVGSYFTGKPPSPAMARLARRKFLPYIPHYHLPGTGIVFKKSDIDFFLEKYRVDPREAVDRAVREAKTFIREAGGK